MKAEILKKIILIITLIFSSGLFGQFAGGSGTESDPYQIATPVQLDSIHYYLGDLHSDKYFKLINDIDLSTYLSSGNPGYNSGEFWLPLGDPSNPFSGKFDGNNHKIINLKINRSSDVLIGLFGLIGNTGEISNLAIDTDSTNGIIGSACTGGLAGGNDYGTIKNSCINGKITGTYSTGGLVGMNYGIIIGCSGSVNVTGIDYVGGLIGSNSSGELSLSYCTGSVSGYNEVGGLSGENFCNVLNSYSTCTVDGNSYIGGLIGRDSGTVTCCYSTGLVTGIDYIGGVFGYTGSTYCNSAWDIENSNILEAMAGYGFTSPQMKQKNSYTSISPDWDFIDIWDIKADSTVSYPFLRQNIQNPPPGEWKILFSGSGTSSDPWKVKTPTDLYNIRFYLGEQHSDKYFEMMNDLDLSTFLSEGNPGYNFGRFWYPVGNDYDYIAFNGQFNGSGYKISNLKINRDYLNNSGLFGSASYTAVIENLSVDIDPAGSVIGKQETGIIVGRNAAVIRNCHTKGDIYGDWLVGGIAGSNGGTIELSSSSGNVYGNSVVGGLAGYNSGNIYECYSNSGVTGESKIGGMIGHNDPYNYSCEVINCYSTGNVTGSNYMETGGFVGKDDGGMGFCYSFGQTNGGGFSGTSIAGYSTDCLWDMDVSGIIYSDSGTGCRTNEIKSKEVLTYRGYDFDTVWGIVSSGPTVSYPYLLNNPQNPVPGLDDLFAEGTGTESDPFMITTAEELDNVRYYLGNLHTDKHFKVSNDIDLSQYLSDSNPGYNMGRFWQPLHIQFPMEYNTYVFRGNFNGNGKTISNLKIYRPDEEYIGLFGYIGESGSVTGLNVEIDPLDQIQGMRYLGAIAGYADKAVISNCSASGSLSGENCGGILGYSDLSSLSSSRFTGNCTGESEVGGLIGINMGIISDCSASLNITGYNNLGGIAGSNVGTIQRSSSSGTISGDYCIGGISGQHGIGSISESYSTCSIIASQSFGGGLAGYILESGSVADCYVSGNVTGCDRLGGLIGTVESGTVTNSYSKGTVSGDWDTGGLIGIAYDIIASNCFWDIETSGQTISACGEGKTTTEMKMQSTYTGWDYITPVWQIHSTLNDGYPYLEWQGLIQPLDIPQNVSAVVSGENLTVSWDAVTGATSYKIFSSVDPYGAYADISESGTFAGTSWTIASTESKIFYYIVAVREDKIDLKPIRKSVGLSK